MPFIIVHRVLEAILFPPLNSMIIIIIGGLLMYYRKKFSSLILAFGIITLYVQATPIFAYYLNQQIAVTPPTEEKLQQAQAIVVLGGGVRLNAIEYPDRLALSMSTLIRTNYVASLAHKYPNKLIITSGGKIGKLSSEASIIRNSLINNYKVNNLILMEEKSKNTDENAKYVAQMLKPMKIKNVAVVSQAYHMKRSIMAFKKYGLNPIPAPTDYYYIEKDNPAISSYLPSSRALHYTSKALHEMVGYVVYNF